MEGRQGGSREASSETHKFLHQSVPDDKGRCNRRRKHKGIMNLRHKSCRDSTRSVSLLLFLVNVPALL